LSPRRPVSLSSSLPISPSPIHPFSPSPRLFGLWLLVFSLWLGVDQEKIIRVYPVFSG
jgi:hypothetical protein